MRVVRGGGAYSNFGYFIANWKQRVDRRRGLKKKLTGVLQCREKMKRVDFSAGI
jgi:hypothetical protein